MGRGSGGGIGRGEMVEKKEQLALRGGREGTHESEGGVSKKGSRAGGGLKKERNAGDAEGGG